MKSPKTVLVRPTEDRVKEALFNIIQNDIEGARVLDLFSGSGAVGCEFLSRNASHVHFNDILGESIKTIYSNVNSLNIESEFEITKRDYRSCIRSLGKLGKKFDYIFVDPPYDLDIVYDAVKEIDNSGLLSESGCIIVETNYVLDGDISPFSITNERKYGDVILSFLKVEV